MIVPEQNGSGFIDQLDNEKPILLIVDDEPSNVKLLNRILNSHYDIRSANCGRDALKQVMEEPKPDLIISDIMMPEMNGFEFCSKLKANPEVNRIPVIFITAQNKTADEKKGFEVGAVDYIYKPISPSVVVARVKSHIALANQQKTCERRITIATAELQKTQIAAINMLGEAGHYNDNDTGVHIWRMAAYAKALAKAIDWSVEKADMLELAAPMHDMGKIGIPDSILKAPRKLFPDEWEHMKQHNHIGYSILSKSDTPLFKMAAEIALYHHEKWDGSGYPKQLSGELIPVSARIVAIADVFDALTNTRPYKFAWDVDAAFNEVEKGSGKHFDPKLVDTFIKIKNQIIDLKKEWDLKED